MPCIPLSKTKSFPDIFNHVTYKDTAKALKMNQTTRKNYVTRTPEYFTLDQIHALVEGWCGERKG